MSLSGDRRILCVQRRICPHCNKSVSLKTYKMHKRLYYDQECDNWFVSGYSHHYSNESKSSSESEPESETVQFISSPEELQHEGKPMSCAGNHAYAYQV